ncbi:glutathione peroxidase [Macrococcus equipercicus]|uniref:Glutathione peroxidase n=1 Tax=Macrococcus equipercicus TaxID=69967 RepID=A0A9Q9BM08_9STAP|nr:glutathione peroxidase [Macrococcus equipercicus]KAA1039334.1 glutathione peroxidase [Macrococcus equipercicus]UTH13625.1 glutathione peroxidase [Macrococcus equipercicus]
MSVYQFEATDSKNDSYKLDKYRGHVLLIVNTASKCGLTGQFDGLEQLYQEYKDRGLVVLGFPCNQFANQEPGTAEEAEAACRLNYGVTFPMHEKIDVNGDNTHPLFKYLKSETKGLLGSAVKWNFTKFLVDKEGNVVERYAPQTEPGKLKGDIEKYLEA